MKIPYRNHDDYYGAAAEGLCKAAMNYNEELGGFEERACKYIHDSIVDEIRKEKSLKRKMNSAVLSLSTERFLEGRKVPLIDLIPDENYFEKNVISHYSILDFLRILRNREVKVLLMKMNGFSNGDIAIVEGLSKSRVQQIMKKIRNKYIEFSQE